MYRVSFSSDDHSFEEGFEDVNEYDILELVKWEFGSEISGRVYADHPEDDPSCYPCGDFTGWTCDYYGEFSSAASDVADELENKTIKIEKLDENTKEVISVEEKDISKYLDRIGDALDCEDGECELLAANDVSSSYNAFCRQGKWQFGLMDEDDGANTDAAFWPEPKIEDGKVMWDDNGKILEPIIWFGLEFEDPIEHWIIDRTDKTFEKYTNAEKWKDFWFPSYRSNWDILTGGQNPDLLTWMFAEFGKDVTDTTELLKDCPITLKQDDTKEEVIKKIDDFFLEQYKLSFM